MASGTSSRFGTLAKACGVLSVLLVATYRPAAAQAPAAPGAPNGVSVPAQPSAPRVAAGIPAAVPVTPPRAEAVSPTAPGGVAQSQAVGISSYFVAPEDVVHVKVYQEPDLETTARVSKDGVINFPLIGTVSVGGKTPDDGARLIASMLAKEYLVNPQVTMTVDEYSKRRFTVLGEVQKPGQYDMPDRDSLTLLEAIGAAGGYTHLADQSRIRVKRLEGGKETIVKLNAKSMADERTTANFQVKAGDIITVGESFF